MKHQSNNMDVLMEFIRRSPGAVLSRFLVCAQEEGKIYDFYKTFVEII